VLDKCALEELEEAVRKTFVFSFSAAAAATFLTPFKSKPQKQ
jgi:hypothetical protein